MTNLFAGFDTVATIRRKFTTLKADEKGMLELVNARFIADEPAIFGTPNEDWHRRELEWYKSMSLSVDDIPPPVPAIWRDVASKGGLINSNYGWCIWSNANGLQYDRALTALISDPYSRQALMIYTRPSMHDDAHRYGMRDFVCTNTVQLIIRDKKLHYLVNMRSSDAVFGYKGDFAWHSYVFDQCVKGLEIRGGIVVDRGAMIWNAGSLHVYPRHKHLVEKAWEEGV